MDSFWQTAIYTSFDIVHWKSSWYAVTTFTNTTVAVKNDFQKSNAPLPTQEVQQCQINRSASLLKSYGSC